VRARPIGPSRTPSVWLFAAALGAHLALKGLFFSAPFLDAVFPVEWATGWAVTAATISGAISWAVLVWLLMGVVGRIRPRDLGLSRGDLVDALPVLLWVWILVQATQVLIGSATGTLSLSGPAEDASVALGRAVQAVFGSGLVEEVFYRGFLLTQLFALLRLRGSRERALVLAVAATSVYFGLNHVPAGLGMGLTPAEVGGYVFHCALVGALFAGLYLRTGNLYVAVAGHALMNAPVPFVTSPVDPALVTLVWLCLAVLAWPAVARRFSEAFTVGHLEGRPAL